MLLFARIHFCCLLNCCYCCSVCEKVYHKFYGNTVKKSRAKRNKKNEKEKQKLWTTQKLLTLTQMLSALLTLSSRSMHKHFPLFVYISHFVCGKNRRDRRKHSFFKVITAQISDSKKSLIFMKTKYFRISSINGSEVEKLYSKCLELARYLHLVYFSVGTHYLYSLNCANFTLYIEDSIASFYCRRIAILLNFSNFSAS